MQPVTSGRFAQGFGHEVRLLPTIYVKPFVKRKKNDAADAATIAGATVRPNLHYVVVKSAEHQGRAVAFRTHQCFVGHSAQHRLFIATVKRDNLARKLVREMGLDCLFVETYGSLESGKYENKSDLINHVVRSNQLVHSATIVIGDRQHDIVGAHDNHLKAIGVLWGYGTRPELEESLPEYIVEQPGEIAEILESD